MGWPCGCESRHGPKRALGWELGSCWQRCNLKSLQLSRPADRPRMWVRVVLLSASGDLMGKGTGRQCAQILNEGIADVAGRMAVTGQAPHDLPGYHFLRLGELGERGVEFCGLERLRIHAANPKMGRTFAMSASRSSRQYDRGSFGRISTTTKAAR